MKRTPILFLMILIFCVSFPTSNLLGDVPEELGKLIGKVVDEQTNLLVDEVIRIRLYSSCPDGSSLIDLGTFLSNDRGRFKRSLEPGLYCLEFSSKSRVTKYCRDLNALEIPKDQLQYVNVKKGQISLFIKRVARASQVILKLYDTNSNPLDLKKTFGPNAGARIHVDTQLFCYYESNKANPGLAANEYKIYSLRPGKTKVSIGFSGTGYYFMKSFNIDLKENETHVIDVVVDLNSKTGIEGRILDANGKPHANVYIRIGGVLSMSADTDKNGFYKFLGLKEGVYYLKIYSSKNKIKLARIGNIYVKEGVLIKKDIVLKEY